MKEELTFNAEKAKAYETNARISIPTYDVLFAMIQSYFRSQLEWIHVSLDLIWPELVIMGP